MKENGKGRIGLSGVSRKLLINQGVMEKTRIVRYLRQECRKGEGRVARRINLTEFYQSGEG